MNTKIPTLLKINLTNRKIFIINQIPKKIKSIGKTSSTYFKIIYNHQHNVDTDEISNIQQSNRMAYTSILHKHSKSLGWVSRSKIKFELLGAYEPDDQGLMTVLTVLRLDSKRLQPILCQLMICINKTLKSKMIWT